MPIWPSIVSLAFGALFLATAIRALVFARRHADRFADAGMAERAAWWLRLFRKGGFGEQAEDERRLLARLLALFGGLFFASGAALQLFAGP